MKQRLLLVSFDAVGEGDVDRLLSLPHFGALAGAGCLVRGVQSSFISNTYPAHTSIVTGCHPKHHGVTENTYPVPGDNNPDWRWYEKVIRRPTLFQKAAAAGLTCAAVLWPVTAGSRSIRYNVPEIFANRWWKNQALVSLTGGSPLLQLRGVLKYGREMKGVSQPQLDHFALLMMEDIILRKRPDVMALHLTDADSHKHLYGAHSTEAQHAVERLDARLGVLLAALEKAGIREETAVVVLGDHYQKDISFEWDPNDLLLEKGLQQRDKNGRLTCWRAWVKCAGGTAYLHLKDPADTQAAQAVRGLFQAMIDEGTGPVARFLTDEEMDLSGFAPECPLGIEAADGTAFAHEGMGFPHRGQHGYSLRQPEYTTFYLVQAPGVAPEKTVYGGSILDIAPLCFSLLGLPEENTDGHIHTGLFA